MNNDTEHALEILATPGYFVFYHNLRTQRIVEHLAEHGLVRRVLYQRDLFGRTGMKVYATAKGRQHLRDIEERAV